MDLGPLRRYPAFRRLFIGQTISTFGSEIAAVAAPYQLYQLTHSTLQVGLLSLCELFPLLTLTIAGGAIADAVDRRRMLLITETLLALVALGFAANAALPEPRVWAIYVLTTLAMSVFSLGVAGMNTVIPRLVEPHELLTANAIENVYGSTTNVAGPAVGGLLIAVLGLKGAYLLDAATFAGSLWSIWRLPALRPLHDVERPSLRTIKEGFRFVRRKPVLLGMFLVDSNAMLFGMPRALFPALAGGKARRPGPVVRGALRRRAGGIRSSPAGSGTSAGRAWSWRSRRRCGASRSRPSGFRTRPSGSPC